MPVEKLNAVCEAELDVGIDADDTTLQLTTGHGARFAALAGGDYCRIIVYDLPKTAGAVYEEMLVTAVAGDDLTVVRAIGGTNQAWSAGAWIVACGTPGTFEDLFTRLEALEAGGGVSLVRATLVQRKATISEHTAVTLDAAPTAGNWLVWLSSTWNSPLPLVQGVLASGTDLWECLVNTGGTGFDGVRAFARRVRSAGSTESATIQLPTVAAGGNGQNAVVYEVAGGGGMPVVFDWLQGNGDPRVLSGFVLNDASFMVGMFANTGNSADDPTITAATATVIEGTRATGTSVNGSPRQINPFHCDCERGAETITANYAAAQNTIAVAVVFPPSLEVV